MGKSQASNCQVVAVERMADSGLRVQLHAFVCSLHPGHRALRYKQRCACSAAVALQSLVLHTSYASLPLGGGGLHIPLALVEGESVQHHLVRGPVLPHRRCSRLHLG